MPVLPVGPVLASKCVMGNLAVDTAVHESGEGLYSATLSRDWRMWGPNGGYLAAIALRAAGTASQHARPASMSCQFLNVAEFAPVELRVTRLRGGRRVEALAVHMSQDDKPIIEALVWAVSDAAEGPSREWTDAPEVPAPDGLPPVEELVKAEGGPMLPLWRNYEVRPVEWANRKPDRPAADPLIRVWVRFREQATFPDDPWLDACRAVIATDIAQFPTVTRGFAAKELDFVAPGLDLYLAFHGAAPAEEWLLVEGHGLSVGGGLCSARSSVWSRAGEYLCTGSQQMLIGKRPA